MRLQRCRVVRNESVGSSGGIVRSALLHRCALARCQQQGQDTPRLDRRARTQNCAGRTGCMFFLRSGAGERVGSIEQVSAEGRVCLSVVGMRATSTITGRPQAVPDTTRRMDLANTLLPLPETQIAHKLAQPCRIHTAASQRRSVLSLLSDTVRNRRFISYQALARGPQHTGRPEGCGRQAFACSCRLQRTLLHVGEERHCRLKLGTCKRSGKCLTYVHVVSRGDREVRSGRG